MVCNEFKFSGAANRIVEEAEDDNADDFPLQFPDDNDVDVSDHVAAGQEVAAEHGDLGADNAAAKEQPVCRSPNCLCRYFVRNCLIPSPVLE